jgi:hypothetical protein
MNNNKSSHKIKRRIQNFILAHLETASPPYQNSPYGTVDHLGFLTICEILHTHQKVKIPFTHVKFCLLGSNDDRKQDK